MIDQTVLAYYVVAGFLLSLGAVVAMQLLTGAINTRYLLYGMRPRGRRYFSPERVQLLIVTLWVAFNYLMSVWNDRTSLPNVDAQTLGILGGSHAVYLGGKAVARFLG